MIRLVGAELGRLRSRRMTMVVALGLTVVIALFQLLVAAEMAPLSAADRAQQQAAYAEAHADWTANHESYVQDCVASGETTEECEAENTEPRLEDYASGPPSFADVGDEALLLGAFASLLAAFAVGASFIGAEYSTGSLANWLTFVPRRLVVLGTKLVAVAVGSALAGAGTCFGVLGLAALVTTAYGHPLAGGAHLAAEAGRAVVLAALAGTAGFVIALLTRHTVAALGAVLGYLVVTFVLIAFTFDADGALAWLPPWLPERNLLAFLQHGLTYEQYRDVVGPQGMTQDSVTRHITFGHSALYWAVLLVVALAVSAVVFRRRDVT